MVYVVNDGRQIVARGSGNNDLFRTGVDVRLRFRLAGIKARAFEHDVHVEISPGKFSGVRFRIDGDFFAVHDDGTRHYDGLSVFRHYGVFILNGVSLRDIVTLHRVVFEKMREHFGAGQVVDGDYFITFRTEHLSERKTSDSAETVDSNLCYF